MELQSSQLVEQVMEAYTDLLYRIAYYYVKDPYVAEDMVQEAFIKFYHSNYDEKGELRAYLSRITANTCKDYLKSWTYKKVKISELLLQKERIIHTDRLVHQEELTLLDEAILSLPIKHREAIVYFYLESLSVKDISLLIDAPESTIKSRLKKGKELLKQKLEKEVWEVLLDD